MSQLTDTPELQALLDEAGERGARRALERVGLGHENAYRDVNDLLSLLAAVRTVKKTAFEAFGKALGKWMAIGLLGLISAALYFSRGS